MAVALDVQGAASLSCYMAGYSCRRFTAGWMAGGQAQRRQAWRSRRAQPPQHAQTGPWSRRRRQAGRCRRRPLLRSRSARWRRSRRRPGRCRCRRPTWCQCRSRWCACLGWGAGLLWGSVPWEGVNEKAGQPHEHEGCNCTGRACLEVCRRAAVYQACCCPALL